jgi:hypothetical protein
VLPTLHVELDQIHPGEQRANIDRRHLDRRPDRAGHPRRQLAVTGHKRDRRGGQLVVRDNQPPGTGRVGDRRRGEQPHRGDVVEL